MKWWSNSKSSPSLYLIQDVRKVYNKIIEVQNKPKEYSNF